MIPLSREALIVACKADAAFKYTTFWSHRPRGRELVVECFSQWFPSEFEHAGYRYPTAEHWMMASKARLFGDVEMERKILSAESPGAAKRWGAEVSNFDESIWEDHWESVVTEGCLLKFGQDPTLRRFLLGTGSRILVEASPTDRIWGIGLAADHPDVLAPERWLGLNLLGFCLMRARAQLAAEAS